jgi:hypothetical protein
VVALDLAMTATSGAKPTSFSYYVADTPFQVPGSSNGTMYLQSSVQTFGTNDTGDKVQTQGVLTTFGAGTSPHSYLTGLAGTVSQANQYASTNVVAVNYSAGQSYTLGGIGGFIETQGHLGTMRFWSQAATSMPEPTGILIGLLGVPCVGALVFFARRRPATTPVLA